MLVDDNNRVRTGDVLLAYEKQMIAWVDERTSIESGAQARLSPEALLARVTEQTGSAPASLVLAADPCDGRFDNVARRSVFGIRAR